MEPEPGRQPGVDPGPQPLEDSRWWAAALLGLAVWQGWMTLALFGPGLPWHRLLDDQPVVSGQHPLHLYFGWLGASSLYETGSLDCYDPSFQAGYPKTPVFDSGSRPAELFLALGGGTYQPAAYKIGLAVCCALVPWLLMLAARGLGLSRGASCLGAALGLVVWWGGPCRATLEAGDLDLLLGGLSAVAFMGLVIGFDRAPGVCGWAGLVITGALTWLAQPFLCFLLFPLLLVYYFSVGPRHMAGWHLALLAGLVGAPALNGVWLTGWVRSWWLRVPLQLEGVTLAHRTIEAVWAAPLWGNPEDRNLGVAVFAAAALGILLLNQNRQRPAARLLGLGAAGLFGLAVAGLAWPSLGRLGTSQLALPALWFAVLPAAYALVRTAGLAARWTGTPWRGALVCGVALAAAGFAGHRALRPLVERCGRTVPLAVGLGPDREALVETLRTHTTPEARILWEDRAAPKEGSRWAALLPLLTDRALVGGFGPDLCIEHAYPSLVEGQLAGRPVVGMKDGELEDFCKRYNLGWAVCWSEAAVARFKAWPGAHVAAAVTDGNSQGYLFTLGPRSFLLKGQGRWLHADCRRIALADVVPSRDGEVVLSLHYQAGMQVSPSRVKIERELQTADPKDPIPLIRLRVPAPVSHLTLTWGSP
jgi:hypothetical protein